MKITALTTAQQTEITTLKAALVSAQVAAAPYNKAVAAANTALTTYLNTKAGLSGAGPFSSRLSQGVTLSDDGTALIIMP